MRANGVRYLDAWCLGQRCNHFPVVDVGVQRYHRCYAWFLENAMSDETSSGDDLRTPRRWLGKQEAIRHLTHSAIRLILKQEDPFAIYLIVHSADKLLIDVANKRGEQLNVDWKIYI